MSEIDLVVNTEGSLGVRLSYKKRGRLVHLESWEEVPAGSRTNLFSDLPAGTVKPALAAATDSESVALSEPVVAGPFLAAVRALRSSPHPETFIPVTTRLPALMYPVLLRNHTELLRERSTPLFRWFSCSELACPVRPPFCFIPTCTCIHNTPTAPPAPTPGSGRCVGGCERRTARRPLVCRSGGAHQGRRATRWPSRLHSAPLPEDCRLCGQSGGRHRGYSSGGRISLSRFSRHISQCCCSGHSDDGCCSALCGG